MYSFCAMNSFRMSFWIVPDSARGAICALLLLGALGGYATKQGRFPRADHFREHEAPEPDTRERSSRTAAGPSPPRRGDSSGVPHRRQTRFRDETTGVISQIGGIRVPEHWRLLDSWSIMWTEYYGPPLERCSDLAYSSVVFGTPLANDGEAKPAGSHSHLGEGTCATSDIQAVAQGVRHQMGMPG